MGRRFAHQRFVDSRESIRKKEPIFEARAWPDSSESRRPSDSHSDSRDFRPVLAAIHFLEGRFAKQELFSKQESIRANQPTKRACGRGGPGSFETFWDFGARGCGDSCIWREKS